MLGIHVRTDCQRFTYWRRATASGRSLPDGGRRFPTHNRRSIRYVLNDGFQGPTAIRVLAEAATISPKAVRRTISLRFVD